MSVLDYLNLPIKPFIIGVDEVGWGCLAGPLVVCGVKSPKDWNLEGLNDSKKLSEKRRVTMTGKLNELIEKSEIQFHIAERSNVQIDKMSAGPALKDAYVEIFHKLYDPECLIITDGNTKFDNLGVDAYDKVSLIKADGKVPAVMAASIIAKTYRDGMMKILHELHPMYGWDHNVGYPRPDHLAAITKYGPCPLHRMSYAPMKNLKPTDKQLAFNFSNTK